MSRVSNGPSESEVESGGRLRKVRECIEAQECVLEVRSLVDKAAVLRTNAEVVGDIEVHPSPVKERGFRLPIGKGNADVVARIKNQRAATCKSIWLHRRLQGNVRNKRSRHLMNIGVNVNRRRQIGEFLSVARVSVIGFKT